MLVVNQSKFSLDSDDEVNEIPWFIPFKTTIGGQISSTQWLTHESTVFDFNIGADDWIIFNQEDYSEYYFAGTLFCNK